MERVLPEVVRTGIEGMIEFAYSFEPYFAPTVVLGELCVFMFVRTVDKAMMRRASIGDIAINIAYDQIGFTATWRKLTISFILRYIFRVARRGSPRLR